MHRFRQSELVPSGAVQLAKVVGERPGSIQYRQTHRPDEGQVLVAVQRSFERFIQRVQIAQHQAVAGALDASAKELAHAACTLRDAVQRLGCTLQARRQRPLAHRALNALPEGPAVASTACEMAAEPA